MNRLLPGLLVLFALSAIAQESRTPPAQNSTAATIRYLFDWPIGFPWTQYSIEVQSDGKSHFSGTPHPDETNNDTDPVQQDFTMTAANRQKIFDLAQKLNYFQGDLDSHIKHIAQTGKKTLQYQSSQGHGSATFNWSQNPDVQELTKLFAAISMTFDYGRKLAFQYRFDKLGMDQRMKELQELEANHGVEELHVIVPVLRKIANDPNLMNIDRETAQHLLQSCGYSKTGQSPGQQ